MGKTPLMPPLSCGGVDSDYASFMPDTSRPCSLPGCQSFQNIVTKRLTVRIQTDESLPKKTRNNWKIRLGVRNRFAGETLFALVRFRVSSGKPPLVEGGGEQSSRPLLLQKNSFLRILLFLVLFGFFGFEVFYLFLEPFFALLVFFPITFVVGDEPRHLPGVGRVY